MSDRIVITGAGMVSALGVSLEAALADLERDRRAIVATEVEGREVPHAPVSADYDPGNYMPRKKVRRMDPANTYAIASARIAIEQAGIAAGAALKRNCGVIVGTGYSGFASVVEHQRAYLRDGIAQLTPIHFPNTVYNASAGMVAIELGLDGPNSTVTGLDVSGEYALLYAWMLLRQGMTERVVVVGVDDLGPALLQGLHHLGFAARDAQTPAAPFARGRDGFVPGEGAGALVLETESAARARAASVLGWIEGIGQYASADTLYSHSAHGSALALAAQAALAAAGAGIGDIDWVSSAANGSVGLDRCEADGWSRLLDERHAIVPFKRYVGEFSASGVLRLALGLACAARGRLPEALDQDSDAALTGRARRGRTCGARFLHQGLGLGGNAVSLLVRAQEAGHAH